MVIIIIIIIISSSSSSSGGSRINSRLTGFQRKTSHSPSTSYLLFC
jgi:hypothetical protein